MKIIRNAVDFNSQFAVGALFTYQSIIGVSTPKEVSTTSEAWELGHGDVVVKVSGVRGGICINHLTVAEKLEIFDYRTQDGELWGVWAHGHVDKAGFLVEANKAVFDEEPVVIGDVAYTYLAHRPTHEEDEYPTYWAEKQDDDAVAVTAIKVMD